MSHSKPQFFEKEPFLSRNPRPTFQILESLEFQFDLQRTPLASPYVIVEVFPDHVWKGSSVQGKDLAARCGFGRAIAVGTAQARQTNRQIVLVVPVLLNPYQFDVGHQIIQKGRNAFGVFRQQEDNLVVVGTGNRLRRLWFDVIYQYRVSESNLEGRISAFRHASNHGAFDSSPVVIIVV